MKKYLLIAAVLLCGLKFGNAAWNTPSGTPGQLPSADYGGVYTATNVFSAAGTTVCTPCTGVVYGAWFSTGVTPSGAPQDYLRVFDSTDARLGYNGTDVSWLFYNNMLGTGSSSTAAGFSGPPKPLRFFKGLFMLPSVNTYNNMHLLYFKEP